MRPRWRPERVARRGDAWHRQGHDGQYDPRTAVAIRAVVRTILGAIVSDRPFPQVFEETSGDAQAVFLGLLLPEPDDEIAWHTRYAGLLDSMQGTVVLVHAATEEDLLLSE